MRVETAGNDVDRSHCRRKTQPKPSHAPLPHREGATSGLPDPSIRVTEVTSTTADVVAIKIEPALRSHLHLPKHPLPDAFVNATPENQSPSRRFSAGESVPPPIRCRTVRRPVLPWALFPFKIRLRIATASFEEDRGGFRLAKPQTTRCYSIDCVRVAASHPFNGRLGPKTCSELPTLGDAVEVCPTRSVARLLTVETVLGPR